MKRYILLLIIAILLSCCDKQQVCPTCQDMKDETMAEMYQCWKMKGNKMIRVQCGVDTVYTGDK